MARPSASRMLLDGKANLPARARDPHQSQDEHDQGMAGSQRAPSRAPAASRRAQMALLDAGSGKENANLDGAQRAGARCRPQERGRVAGEDAGDPRQLASAATRSAQDNSLRGGFNA